MIISFHQVEALCTKLMIISMEVQENWKVLLYNCILREALLGKITLEKDQLLDFVVDFSQSPNPRYLCDMEYLEIPWICQVSLVLEG